MRSGLGLGKALIDDAKELLAEDKQRKTLANRRMSAKEITPLPLDSSTSRPAAHQSLSDGILSAITGSSTTETEDAGERSSSSLRPQQAPHAVESAETFLHRRKLSESQQPRPSAMSLVYGSSGGRPGSGSRDRDSKGLPGDLGPNDPRRAPSPMASQSQSPSRRRLEGMLSKQNRPRRASDGALLRPKSKRLNSDDATRRLPEDVDSDPSHSDSDSDSDAERGRGRDRSSRSGSVIESESEADEGATDRQKQQNDPPYSPSITVTPPPTATVEQQNKNKGVHPHSAYDHSATSTPRHSDDEEHLSDLRRAQKLSLTISPVHSTPSAHRVIRQIIRGDYAHLQREAESGRRRQRVYLVATDLSPEAEYALEWTIGTVLRDGDTLLALYAVDEEGSTATEGVEIGHGADVIRDTASIVGSLPTQKVGRAQATSPFTGRVGGDGSLSRAVGPEKTRAERERVRAAEAISERVVKLLRKTRLQIRVVVEVFHCKSPRHMITEVIDFLSPTMTILGSRGRSALKGVLLGSFSNYIVTKSSVPVMVARRRLKKHTKQRLHKDGLPIAGTGDGRMHISRMSNVLEAPPSGGRRVNRLSVAKVD